MGRATTQEALRDVRYVEAPAFAAGIKVSFERGIGAVTSDATIPNEEAPALLAIVRYANRPGLHGWVEALEWALEADTEEPS